MKNAGIFIILLTFFACGQPRDTSSPANFSLQYSDQGNIEFLRELIDDRPNNPKNYVRLAEIYLERGNTRQAIQLLRSANEEIPGNESIEMLLIKALIQTDNKYQTEELIRKVNLTTENIDHYILLAEYSNYKKEYTKALDNINRAIALDNGDADYFDLKANILLQIDDTSGAVNSFDRALEKSNVKYSTIVSYLELLATLNDREKFQEVYHLIPGRYREDPRTYLSISEYMIRTNDLDSAKNLAFHVNNPNFEREKVTKLVRINFNQRNYDSVLFYLSDYKLESPELLLLEARTYDRMNQYQNAENSYLEILKSDSTHIIARQELEKLQRKVRYLRDLKRREENRIDFIQIRPLVPNN
mgnify:CR=1 FL=1